MPLLAINCAMPVSSIEVPVCELVTERATLPATWWRMVRRFRSQVYRARKTWVSK